MKDRCHLCGEVAHLEISHFIPKFVGKWLKKTSFNGYLRNIQNIRKREQDIVKKHWLCGKCEDLFQQWEHKFAENIFFPFNNNKQNIAHYDIWLVKFCASLSWRTLSYVRNFYPNRTESIEDTPLLNEAEIKLADFLQGKDNSLYQYKQHLIPLETVSSTTETDIPGNLNRYLLRALSMDVIKDNEDIIIFTKLPGFLILGIISINEKHNMCSSEISLNKGTIKPREYFLPGWLGVYINYQAKCISDEYSKILEKDLDKFETYILENIEKTTSSKQFEAFLADLNLSGYSAFKK